MTQIENLIKDDKIDDINDYIDSILDNYNDLGKKPCVSILKCEKKYNQINIIVMYSATELKECKNIKKHINRCSCCNIIYVTMILDNDLNLIQINNNSIYINNLYEIVLKVFEKLNEKN